jgi:hypothetical protein
MLTERLRKFLRHMDGLLIQGNSKNLPHPVDISKLEGLYEIDVENSRFRVTAKGWNMLREDT